MSSAITHFSLASPAADTVVVGALIHYLRSAVTTFVPSVNRTSSPSRSRQSLLQHYMNLGAALVLPFRTFDLESNTIIDQEGLNISGDKTSEVHSKMANCKIETDTEGNVKEERNQVQVPAYIETSQAVKRWADKGGELFPGILDDVTLFHITPKLSWRDLRVLLSVSPGWQKSLESQEIFDRRVGSTSLDTFVVVNQESYTTGFWGLERNCPALYSIRDKYCYKLPSFPFSDKIPYGSQCISCNGTIYVLGGMDPELESVSSQVYKLGLGGRHHWKPCASMIQPRMKSGAVALNGKIYVFGGSFEKKPILGGIFEEKPVLGCEMYDPKLDAWFPIGPIPLCRYGHKVEVVGEELIVYGGWFITDDFARMDDHSRMSGPSILTDGDHLPFLDAYHPLKGEWRRINPSEVKDWNNIRMFVAQERFHEITPEGICVYDLDKDSWSLLHPFQGSLDLLHPFQDAPHCCYFTTVAFDDELLYVYTMSKLGEIRSALFRSRGFGIKDRVLTWAELDFPVFLNMGFPYCMITTQL